VAARAPGRAASASRARTSTRHPKHPAVRKADSDETIKLKDLSTAEVGLRTVVIAATSPFRLAVGSPEGMLALRAARLRPPILAARANLRGRPAGRSPRSSCAQRRRVAASTRARPSRG
jgi:hypothetical protein